jgi:predicted O-methyltransferase YrrM
MTVKSSTKRDTNQTMINKVLDEMDGNFGALKAEESPAQKHAVSLLGSVPNFEKIEGWLKPDAAELLFAAAASINSGCIVEVGSYRGRSTVALCAGSMAGSQVPVYAIDPHEHFVGIKGSVFGPGDRRAFFRTMLTSKFASIVRLVNLSSEVVSPGWEKGVSMLFIDGDHRYEAVLSDFSNWRPHLTDHALVVFHDATGAGTALLIKDLVSEGALTHIQTAGRLAMFWFNPQDAAVDPQEVPTVNIAPVYPAVSEPTVLREGQTLHAIGEQVYYSARGNYLYQPIAKCGATTVKTALLELEGLPVDPNPAKRLNKELNKFPGTEILTSQDESDLLGGRTDALKFTFVRDPYTRLASVYADKISGGYMRGSYFWINQIQDSATKQGITPSERITFEEFVRVVAGQRGREMDHQWRHQYHCGRFDTIKFDFVGRVETIASDLSYVLERLHAPAEMMHRAIRPLQVVDTSMTMWNTVSAEVRAEFLKKFAIDFEALRYPMRHASVVFMPVNVDRPVPSPFVLPSKSDSKSRAFRRKQRLPQGEAQDSSAASDAEENSASGKLANFSAVEE